VVNYFTPKKKKCWKTGSYFLDFNKGPLIMGILNVTPDSFSDGGRYIESQKAIDHALEMVESGADIIDVGGESTRPGADQVEVSQELERVIPVIEEIKKHSNVIISIDTFKSRVAKEAIEAGADIINDISGTVFDERMKSIIEKKKCPVILMHIKGTPKNMQVNPKYTNIHEEIYQFLQKKCSEIESLNDGKIIIDPGIGFGKSFCDNLKLLRDIKDFTFLSKPILIGVSRKSFLGKILKTKTKERLLGSLASEIYAYLNGVDILRVHDIDETVQVKNILNTVFAA
jgi:dihydropteroate synthase